MTRRTKNVWIGVGLLGIFLAGALTGALAVGGYLHHRLAALHDDGPAGLHRLGVSWLRRELSLDDRQAAEVDRLLHEVHLELFRFKSDHNAELEAIVTPALQRMDELLRPEQREAWRPLRGRVQSHLEATFEDRFGARGPRGE